MKREHYSVVNIPQVFCVECQKRRIFATDCTPTRYVRLPISDDSKKFQLIPLPLNPGVVEVSVTVTKDLTTVLISCFEILQEIGWGRLAVNCEEIEMFKNSQRKTLALSALSDDLESLLDAEITFMFASVGRSLNIRFNDCL